MKQLNPFGEVYLEGESLMNKPLSVRKAILGQILNDGEGIRLLPFMERGVELFKR